MLRLRSRISKIPAWIDVWLILTWLLVLLVLFRPVVHGYDPVGYFSWVRSMVIQGNLDVTDEFVHYGIQDARPRSATGYTASPWGVGTSLLWSPFYILTHGLVRLGALLGATVPADGYSWPYPLACALASALYALAGLLLLKFLIEEWGVQQRTARLAVVTVWLASPLIFYMSANSLMSHACEFFTIVLFLFFWTRAPESRSLLFLVGLVGGLAACVRLQNAPILALAVGYFSFQALRRQRLSSLFSSIFWTGAGALVGLAPQLITWKVIFGSWLVGNPYAASGEQLDWTAPYLVNVLFSATRGLFPWIPAAVPAVWGLCVITRTQPKWAAILIPHAVIQIWAISSWYAWWGGAAFGPRFLISILPAIGLGLAVALNRLRRYSRPCTLLCGVLVAWNLMLLARYGVQDIPRNAPISWQQLVLGQFRFAARLPDYVTRLLDGLLRQLS